MTGFGRLSKLNDISQVTVEKLEFKESQFDLFRKIYASYDKVFILESLVGPKELSEMSIIGFDPEYTVTCDSKWFKISDRKKILSKDKVTDPLKQLSGIIPRIHDNRFRFVGGAVGYICYDAVRFWENLPVGDKKESGFPLLDFGIYLDGVLYDHKVNQAYYFYTGSSRLDEIYSKLGNPFRKSRFSYTRPVRNISRAAFERMVRKAKKYVYDGHVFQVVIAKKMNFTVRGDVINLYDALREVNPSPYMYLVKMSERSIIGSSPEMLIRITGDIIETFPIAGTRPVVKDDAENERLRKDLITDEKELAEHTMLVDLARNDIGRVCRFGSVKVDELMTIKRFSHVQHIVSHVKGQLRPEKDSFDALRAVFPAGTVSGAPKVRAMEVIDELEPALRGPYAGAVGYFSFNGSCDFAITIRSLFIKGQRGYLQSGAGIVMDSDPSKEWDETEHKANAMIAALRIAASL